MSLLLSPLLSLLSESETQAKLSRSSSKTENVRKEVFFVSNRNDHRGITELHGIRPCSHYANFCLFCKKKTVNRKPFSGANDFFYLPWFSQLSPNFKNAVEEYSEAYNSLTGDKVLCSMTAIINRVILSRENDQLCSLLGRRSKGKGKGIRTRDHARGRREEGSFPFSLVGPTRSREPKFPRPLFLLTPATQATNYANKVAKTKNWWLQDFQTFCKRKTLQVVRHSANRA